MRRTINGPTRSRPQSARPSGWSYWKAVWAAWCPTCAEETMPFPSGRCGFCDGSLAGQPTRGPYELPLEPPSAPSPDVQDEPAIAEAA